LFFYDSNDISAENTFEKVTVTGDGSNNSGSLGAEPPAAGGQLGFGGGDTKIYLSRNLFNLIYLKPSIKTNNYGNKVFARAAADVWNVIPQKLKQSDSLSKTETIW